MRWKGGVRVCVLNLEEGDIYRQGNLYYKGDRPALEPNRSSR